MITLIKHYLGLLLICCCFVRFKGTDLTRFLQLFLVASLLIIRVILSVPTEAAIFSTFIIVVVVIVVVVEEERVRERGGEGKHISMRDYGSRCWNSSPICNSRRRL